MDLSSGSARHRPAPAPPWPGIPWIWAARWSWTSSTPRTATTALPGARRRGAGARLVRRRARPARPVPRGLGDQVRAGAPRRRAAGRWTSTLPSSAYVPELAGSGYGGVPVRDVARMTSGVDWVEDHRDPDGPATALVGAFAAGGSSRALLARVGPRSPARHPLRVLHGRLPGARLGARTRHRRRLPRRARRAVAHAGLHRRRVGRRRRRRRGAWPAAASPRRPETGPGSACSQSTAAARRAVLDRTGSRAPGRRCRSCAPGRLPAPLSTHARLRLPLVAARRRRHRA